MSARLSFLPRLELPEFSYLPDFLVEPDPGEAVVREAVRAALAVLDENEYEVMIRYHFMGQSCREIAQIPQRSPDRVERLLRRGMRRLRAQLAPFVADRYDVVVSGHPDCPICQSPYRKRIDRIIAERDRTRTWGPVMRRLHEELGLKVAPQRLIGHEKYHC